MNMNRWQQNFGLFARNRIFEQIAEGDGIGIDWHFFGVFSKLILKKSNSKYCKFELFSFKMPRVLVYVIEITTKENTHQLTSFRLFAV